MRLLRVLARDVQSFWQPWLSPPATPGQPSCSVGSC
jgi:hypothetical protein